MRRAISLLNRIKNKFHSKFSNHKGELNIGLIFLYIFSKDILNIPIRIKGKVFSLFKQNNVKSSAGNVVGLSLPLLNKKKYTFINHKTPTVSIIIPIYNQINYTIDCLIGLHKNISKKYSFEIIIINDQSTDNSVDVLYERFSGITIITNEKNLGFVLSCNKGASVGVGNYLCFLNNDTFIQPNWLETLVDKIESDHSIGLVGSMLIYPNGALQEAGNIIWSNGEGWNFGRNGNRFSPKYNYCRQVDYISGASILLSKEDFNVLNGFDTLFVPAYYEDTDLCMRIRHTLGKKVVYCPNSKIIHFEGITSGKDLNSGVKKHQLINKEAFLDKWKSILNEFYFTNTPENVLKSIQKYNPKHILIIDSYVPCYNRESGSNRLFQIIKILKSLGYKISFIPDNENAEQPYTNELQEMGVQVLYRQKYYYQNFNNQLSELTPFIDVAWICRPELFEKYFPKLTKNKKIKFIYDTIDLHFLRLKRESELFSNKKNNWEAIKNMEITSASIADVTLAITPVDKNILKDLGIDNVEVIPNIHSIKYVSANSDDEFSNRSGLLFIGSYTHTPNVDAVIWLVEEIMPLVWNEIPNLTLTLLGSNPKIEVLKYQSDKIIIPGFIDDVSSYFNSNKVFVAPLRYGAGMKGKIGQSLEYGLPIVSTSIGVEGMNMAHEKNVLVGDSEIEFATHIIRLYQDKALWNTLRKGGENVIHPYTSESIQNKIKHLIECL